MAKYHINNDGTVGLCKAIEKCPFGGPTGFENHYSTIQKAQRSAESMLSADFPIKALHKRSLQRAVNAIFIHDNSMSERVRVFKEYLNEFPYMPPQINRVVTQSLDPDNSLFKGYESFDYVTRVMRSKGLNNSPEEILEEFKEKFTTALLYYPHRKDLIDNEIILDEDEHSVTLNNNVSEKDDFKTITFID